MIDPPLVSVVIPVWRDERALAAVLARLDAAGDSEVVVAPVLGEEPRYEALRARHPAVRWAPAPRGRAAQMNAGAAAARGRWLLFLHADSALPENWTAVIRDADARPGAAGGAFRLALDSPRWQARAIEAGVRLRVALFGMPYGDQAIFVRRRVFDALGGYRDLPLMEDIDLVRRLKRAGTLVRASAAVRTSARRWERDGWFRRSAHNVALATRFLLGAPPAALARRYFGRRADAVVMMARAPWEPGKTRLAADAAGHAALRDALFRDTLDVVAAIDGAAHVVACEPAAACERLRTMVGSGVDVIAQRGGDLGERLRHVFEDVWRLGHDAVVVIGSDLPDLPPRLLQQALTALHGPRDRVVLGPAADGGYYLVAMRRPHAELFEGIAWSTDRVLAQTLDAARRQGVDTVLLDTWSDVDDAADLARLASGAGGTAARTRACAARLVSRG